MIFKCNDIQWRCSQADIDKQVIFLLNWINDANGRLKCNTIITHFFTISLTHSLTHSLFHLYIKTHIMTQSIIRIQNSNSNQIGKKYIQVEWIHQTCITRIRWKEKRKSKCVFKCKTKLLLFSFYYDKFQFL